MALSFDATYYLNARPDVFHAFVATAGATGKTWAQFAEEHYNTFGRFEGANPNATFNTDEYLAANPDVAAAGVNPFTHYLHFGAAEGRAPSNSFPSFASFDSAAYLAANPDLGAAGIDTPNEAYAHFVIFGQFESRPGAPEVDNGLPGQIFTLTDKVGEIVNGTNGNDTFKAVLGATSAVSTLQLGDTIDGKGGKDTLELIVDGGTALPTGASVSNVENIVITNAATSLADIDASVFAGSEKIVLKNNATAVSVTNMSGKVLGVDGVAAQKVTGDFGTATAATLDLNGAKGSVDLVGTAVKTANISGGSQVVSGVAQTVTLGGSATAAATTLNINASAALALNITGADAAATINVKGAGATNLGTLDNVAKTLDASANTGGVTVTGGTAATSLQAFTGGTGNDSVTLGAALADKGAIKTGAGNDTVDVGNNAVNKGAVVELGAGNDKFIGTGVIDKDAIVDGGEGIDTLALEMVGAANVGAFRNFEVFDVKAMTAKTLDLDILASKNTVTEITGSGALTGAVTLTNLGADVGFTAVKNMIAAGTVAVKTAPVAAATEILTLTQKTAGALTVTLNSDSSSTTAANDAAVAIVASNATSLKAEFASDSGFVQTVGAVATENNQAIVLTGTKATTLEVVSGGTNATNLLSYTVGAGAVTTEGVLTSATVTGTQALTLDFAFGALTSKLATVDASALSGSLTFDLADLANGGSVTLGTGADIVKAGVKITTSADIESVVNFTKSASKDADHVKVADILDFAAAATVGTGVGADVTVTKGVATFNGTGPTTLDAAITLVDLAVTTGGAAVVFEYLGNSYVYQQGGTVGIADDFVVKLTGVSGVGELAVNGSGDVYLV